METRQTIKDRIGNLISSKNYKIYRMRMPGGDRRFVVTDPDIFVDLLVNVAAMGYELGQKDAKEVLLLNKFNDLKNEQGVLSAILETGKVVNEIMIKAHMI